MAYDHPLKVEQSGPACSPSQLIDYLLKVLRIDKKGASMTLRDLLTIRRSTLAARWRMLWVVRSVAVACVLSRMAVNNSSVGGMGRSSVPKETVDAG